MNENAKKIGVGAIAVLAVGAAIYEAITFVKGPPLHESRILGHGTPGHGMRQKMNALAGKGAATSESNPPASQTP